MVAPKLGVVARPVEALTVRLNGGRLFRDPGFDELYFVGQGVRGNPELRPEDGWGGDVGVEGRLGPVSVEVVGFAQRYDRLIVFVPLDAYRVGARDDFAAAVHGVEAAARVEGAWFGVEVAYLGQRAQFTSGGAAPLPYRPAHRVTGLAQVTVGPVTPFVGGRWQGEVTVDRFGARRQAGYGLVDGGLRVALPWGLGAAVEVANALDRRGAFDVAQRPLPGRSLVVELSGRWD
ncbi:MAG: TonB-dependent receptor [bacterium]